MSKIGLDISLEGLIGYYRLSNDNYDNDNLVSNPDWVDSNDDGLADYWITSYNITPLLSIEEGQRVMTYTGISNYYEFGVRPTLDQYPDNSGRIGMTSGFTYRISGRVKTSNGNSIAIRVGGYGAEQVTINVDGVDTWTNFDFYKQCGSLQWSPDGNYSQEASFIGQGVGYTNYGEWFEIDNISIKEVTFQNIINKDQYRGYSYNTPAFSGVGALEDYSMNFNGVDDNVVCNSSQWTEPTCINFWFKSLTSSEQIIIGGVWSAHVIQINGGKLHTSTGNPGVATVRTDLGNGQWYNACVIRDVDNPHTSGFTIYIDGKKEEVTDDGSYRASSIFNFGSRYYSNQYSIFFNGELSDILFYNRNLTEEEIIKYYDVTKGRYNKL